MKGAVMLKLLIQKKAAERCAQPYVAPSKRDYAVY